VSAVDFQLTTLPSPAGESAAVPVVQVRGDIDITNAAQLRQDLTEVTSGPVIVDLSDVGYFDSAGFAVLDRLLSRGTVAVVVAPGSVVHTAMALMALSFHDSVDAARASLRLGRT
jgi:anti-sigma B factor antagonist